MNHLRLGQPGHLEPDFSASPDFLSGGGELGALMRAHDWSCSSLGPPHQWPQSLRTVVRIMLNTGHPMYIFWGVEGSCLYNDAYRESIGSERHPGSLGLPAREVWAEIWPIIGPQIEQVLSGGGATWNVNHLVPITRNGRREDVYWTYSYSPIDDASAPGGIGGVLVVCTETTAQILSARSLAAARDKAESDAQQLNVAMEAARLGDWRWEAATDMVAFSERAAKIFAIPPGAPMTWAALRDLLHPDDRERARLAVEEAIGSRGDYLIEYRLTNGGRERWISASGRARYDEDGAILCMFGVVQDISSDRFLVHLDDEVRTVSDPDEITFKAASLLGAHLHVSRCAYAVVEDNQDTFLLTGNYVAGTHSIVGSYHFRQFGAACLSLMRCGQPFVVEDSELDERIDETDREAYRSTAIRAVICVPILKSGKLVAAMAVHQIAARVWAPAEVALVQQVASRCWESLERSRFEGEQLHLLALAQEANRAKDEFLAMLGHELRNPLSPILTALQIMRLRAPGDSVQERAIIERQVRHLTRLVDDLLDVSRIVQGKVELKSAPVEIADVVSRAMEMSGPLFEQRFQDVTVEIDPARMTVAGDAARLDQVVANLLTNASKYTPQRGSILVRAWPEDSEVVIAVIDSGLGIAAEVLPKVFDLFVQARQALDRSEGGLGLG
ncbi:MAG: histidine kinase dimerization/phospho-acceptor domain-containing protein, partial [Thermoanaerobaculia bacterium]